MKKRLEKLMSDTTCHGIPDFHDSTHPVEWLFWSVLLVTAFGAICYYQYNLVATFMSAPTVTKISNVAVDNLTLPNVTICNLNAFSMAKMNAKFAVVKPRFIDLIGNSSTSIELLDWLRLATLTEPTADSPGLSDSEIVTKEFLILFNKSYEINYEKFDYIQFMIDISYSCQDIFPLSSDCAFGAFRFNCCAFAESTLTHYGNCYKLRPTVPDDKNLAQILPGFNFGLQITMTFNSSDGPIYSPSGVSQEGFYLSIGDHMTVLDSSAVTVGPGKYVSVNLSLHRYLYDPSVSTCTSALAALNYTKGGVTSVDLCKQECQVMINLKFCFCSPPYPNVQLPADKICQPQSAYSCFQRDGSLLTNSTYRAAVKNCQNQNCPNLCDSLRYVPFTVYSMAAPKNPGGDTMLETSVANVFFEEFAYTLNEEKPLMDVTSLISGFGGNLGLFAGMSLITIVQCLAAFICACHDKWNGNFVGPVNESNESPETNDLNLIESLSPESLYGDTNYSAWGSPIYL